MSDVHLEFRKVDVSNTVSADVLILSGDICVANDFNSLYKFGQLGQGNRFTDRYLEFFDKASSEYKHVIYVPGNHEFYGGKWVKSIQVLRTIMLRYNNVHFLENDTVTIDNVAFVGGTLWTDMNNIDPITMHSISSAMNDFRVIRNDAAGFTKLRPAHCISRFRQTVQYIRDTISKLSPELGVVVVTHHTPTSLSIHEQYKSEYILNGGYSSNLSEFILDHNRIKLWTCGHVHHPHWYYVGKTLVACNPCGYPGESEDTIYNEKFVVDLNSMPEPAFVESYYNHVTAYENIQ